MCAIAGYYNKAVVVQKKAVQRLISTGVQTWFLVLALGRDVEELLLKDRMLNLEPHNGRWGFLLRAKEYCAAPGHIDGTVVVGSVPGAGIEGN